jgi:hypothetical protein
MLNENLNTVGLMLGVLDGDKEGLDEDGVVEGLVDGSGVEGE